MQRLTWHCSQKFFCFSCFLWTFLQVVWVSLQFSTGTTYYFLYSPPKLSSKRIFCTERAIPCGFLDGFVDGFPDSQLDSWIIASRNPGFLDSQCSEIDSVTLSAWQNRSEHWISLRTLDFRLFAIETGPNLSDIVEAITRVMYLVSVWVFLWIVIKKKIDQNETVSFYRARFQIHLFQTKPEVRRRSNNVFCVSNNSSGNSKSLTISTFGWKFIRS